MCVPTFSVRTIVVSKQAMAPDRAGAPETTIGSLIAIEAVGKQLIISRAAHDPALTQSTVSRQVMLLEHQLNVKLDRLDDHTPRPCGTRPLLRAGGAAGGEGCALPVAGRGAAHAAPASCFCASA